MTAVSCLPQSEINFNSDDLTDITIHESSVDSAGSWLKVAENTQPVDEENPDPNGSYKHLDVMFFV